MKPTNYIIFVFLFIYLIVVPSLIYIEYKTNNIFKEVIVCETSFQNYFLSCPLHEALEKTINKSEIIIQIVILFFILQIIEDIYKNKTLLEKIRLYANK